MPDPILTDQYRALAIMHHESGLPEDVFVNSWGFRNDGATDQEAMAANVQEVLSAFYQESFDGNPALMNYYPDSIESVELRVYDLGQQPPRIPVIVPLLNEWVTGTGTNFPGEVALCLSFVATRNQPRSRGRIYLGPLTSSAGQEINGVLRPSPTFQSVVANAAVNVLETSQPVTWTIISQMDAAAKEVTGGWVDNAWDTVRKRGLMASGREQWGTYTS